MRFSSLYLLSLRTQTKGRKPTVFSLWTPSFPWNTGLIYG